jgi:hypothetical protein
MPRCCHAHPHCRACSDPSPSCMPRRYLCLDSTQLTCVSLTQASIPHFYSGPTVTCQASCMCMTGRFVPCRASCRPRLYRLACCVRACVPRARALSRVPRACVTVYSLPRAKKAKPDPLCPAAVIDSVRVCVCVWCVIVVLHCRKRWSVEWFLSDLHALWSRFLSRSPVYQHNTCMIHECK